jgi:hypothetical protein
MTVRIPVCLSPAAISAVPHTWFPRHFFTTHTAVPDRLFRFTPCGSTKRQATKWLASLCSLGNAGSGAAFRIGYARPQEIAAAGRFFARSLKYNDVTI